MSDVTYTRKRFSTKAIGANGSQVFERFELRSGEAFTEDWKIFFLLKDQ